MKPSRAPGAYPDPARGAAVELLVECESSAGSFDTLLERLNAGDGDARDRRFVRQLAAGVVKWRSRLDWVLDRFASRPVAAMDPPARQILRLGAFQLLFLDRVPGRAVVHSSVELAKHFGHRGIASMVNAVLRQVHDRGRQLAGPGRDGDPVGYLAVWFSHPQWLVERWVARWGAARTEALLRANNEPGRVWVRPQVERVDAVQLAGALDLEAPAGSEPPGDALAVPDPTGLFAGPAFADGLFFVQDANAGLPVALLDPQPGERVLDVCSAPGGKAVQAALAVGPGGRVVAADLSRSRLERLHENRHRLGLGQLQPLVEDGARPAVGVSGAAATFDRVLVDAPCTGTGVLARHPEARWLRRPRDVERNAALQGALLAAAWPRLRPGGVLVYSTCSLEEEENDAVVDRFLTGVRRARLEPAGPLFPGTPWARRCIQTLPGRDPGDGSFAARIRKVEA